ncbi:MAG: PRC-barrel domain-containing protein [Steroidobacteraceae bacterium]
MIRILLPLLCAVLGLAAASCSQSEGPFASAVAPASAPSSSQDAASAAMTSPSDPASVGMAASTGPAERRASRLIGMPVVSADGSPLGEVKDIILDPQGHATHVVIAYRTQSEAGAAEIPEGKLESSVDGKLVAVPWDTIIAHLADDHVVLDGANLQSAPSFTPGEWPNLADPAWSTTADAYWRKLARPPAVARRGAPIDSTARLRARPTRDGGDD